MSSFDYLFSSELFLNTHLYDKTCIYFLLINRYPAYSVKRTLKAASLTTFAA